MPLLRVTTGEGQIFNFPLTKDKITLGRSKDNDLVIYDNTVSRYHAEVRRSDKGQVIVDLGSYNGTKVNGRLVQMAPLSHNDLIQVGLTKLEFLDPPNSEIAAETVLFAPETDEEKSKYPVIASSPFRGSGDSSELIFNIKKAKSSGSFSTPKGEPSLAHEKYLSVLERSNKVLFVLYEISRQLNEMHDLNQLLEKIMQLILMVIDADAGFLMLLGPDGEDDFIPVVVKHRIKPGRDEHAPRPSKTLMSKVVRDKIALLTSNAMEDARLHGARSVAIQKIRSAMCVPLWRKDKVIGVIQLDCTRVEAHFTNEDLELLKAIAGQMALIIEQAYLNEKIRHEEQMRSRLERFHSPQVVEMILSGGQKRKDNIMEPKELTATVLFADIIDFTRLAERLPPQEVTIILNRFFSIMTDIIFHYDGTLDKYIGDGLMAVFGAPMQREGDARRAVLAALDMRNRLKSFKMELGEDKRFDIRIGINSGKVVAGNIGSPKRLDYTVIGDPVNLASRLESMASPNQILVGEETYKLVSPYFITRPLGAKKVKGKSSSIMVYEIVGPK